MYKLEQQDLEYLMIDNMEIMHNYKKNDMMTEMDSPNPLTSKFIEVNYDWCMYIPSRLDFVK